MITTKTLVVTCDLCIVEQWSSSRGQAVTGSYPSGVSMCGRFTVLSKVLFMFVVIRRTLVSSQLSPAFGPTGPPSVGPSVPGRIPISRLQLRGSSVERRRQVHDAAGHVHPGGGAEGAAAVVGGRDLQVARRVPAGVPVAARHEPARLGHPVLGRLAAAPRLLRLRRVRRAGA